MDNFYQILFLILIYVISVVINRIAKGKQDKEMKELAATLSLDYIEGGLMHSPRVAGVYEGHTVMIENVARSRGRDQKLFFRVMMNGDVSIPDSIRIHNALSFGPVTGLFGEIGEFFGVHDIQFDNSVFNDKFVIRGKNEALVKSVIDESVQEALINIGRVNLVIQDNEIIYEDEGSAPENESRIRIILSFEDRIATTIAQTLASGIPAEGETTGPAEGYRQRTQTQYAHRQEPARQQVTVDMGRIYKVTGSDITAPRSDYYPINVSPDSVISQLKREGYYAGE